MTIGTGDRQADVNLAYFSEQLKTSVFFFSFLLVFLFLIPLLFAHYPYKTDQARSTLDVAAGSRVYDGVEALLRIQSKWRRSDQCSSSPRGESEK